jgi:hypothetical protein
VPVERRLARPGTAGDGLHREPGRALLGELVQSCGQDARPSAVADKIVLNHATEMGRSRVEVTAELSATPREQFDETKVVELTHVIALENLRGRFTPALGIGAAGFSAGSVCAVPAPPTAREDQP